MAFLLKMLTRTGSENGCYLGIKDSSRKAIPAEIAQNCIYICYKFISEYLKGVSLLDGEKVMNIQCQLLAS